MGYSGPFILLFCYTRDLPSRDWEEEREKRGGYKAAREWEAVLVFLRCMFGVGTDVKGYAHGPVE